MHTLNKEFDKVICINLAERPDKKDKMQKKFNELGIEVEWFTSVKYGFFSNIIKPIIESRTGFFNINQPNELGAAFSHYTVMKQALIQGCKKIFVFEDDIKFHKDFNIKLDSYLNDLPSNWDLILLYSFMYNFLPQNIRVSKRWIKSYNSWSLTSYGINKKAMEEYIRRQDKFFTIADKVTYDMQEDPKFNIYNAIPTICVPETDLGSDIRGTNQNYKFNPTILNMGYDDNNYTL